MYKKRTLKEINLFRISLGMSGVVSNNAGAETILIVYDEVKKKGGNFSLKDASEIECYIKQKYYPEPKPEKQKK